jgi:hypothetical protein
MLAALEKEFGERKIDIVINNFQSHLPVYDIAKQEGILPLNKNIAILKQYLVEDYKH